MPWVQSVTHVFGLYTQKNWRRGGHPSSGCFRAVERRATPRQTAGQTVEHFYPSRWHLPNLVEHPLGLGDWQDFIFSYKRINGGLHLV